MKCTECSRQVRPVVALDIDGTLGDYHGHFTNFMCGYFGVEKQGIGNYTGDLPMREWAKAQFGCDDQEYRQAKLAYRQGGMKRTMPPILNMVMLAKQIPTWDAELWLTTTRPYLRLDTVDPDTREWLSRYGIKYQGMLYDDDKYARLAEIVDPNRVVAVVDDIPELVNRASEVFGKWLFGKDDWTGMLHVGLWNARNRNVWSNTYVGHGTIPEEVKHRVMEWHGRNG